MSKIEEQVVAQQIEHLDFDPTCKLTTRHIIRWYGVSLWKTKRKRCGRKAVWAASVPCCGYVMPACEGCHHSYTQPDNTFVHCREFPATMITWSRI